MFVRASVCVLRVCVCEVLTSSWNCGESVRERGGKNGFGEDKGALLSEECTSLCCIFNFTYQPKEDIESLSCAVVVLGCYSDFCYWSR